MLFKEFSAIWLAKRKVDFPKATTDGDTQRIRDYLDPLLGDFEMKSITMQQCKHVLTKICEPNFKPGQTLSTTTRDRVKAVLSSIMSSAINEYPPLIDVNPVRDIRFSERRKGKKLPRTLGSREECIKFIEAAGEIGHMEHMIASIFLMTGCRKSELIALRWDSFDQERKSLHIKEKLEQASGLILPGTKSGSNVTRFVPIPKDLVNLILIHKEKTEFKNMTDFILSNKNGGHLTARQVSSAIEKIRSRASLDIAAHGLRHSYGREFVRSGGNLKVLQSVMGHSNSTTTDIYSNLDSKKLEAFSETISFKNDRKTNK